jgi:hypothetical protein
VKSAESRFIQLVRPAQAGQLSPDLTINHQKSAMSFAEQDRSVLEVRELLAKQRNKEVVINYYINRGMEPDEAREMVTSIYKENLSVNRKSSLGVLIGGGIGTALGLLVLVGARRISTGLIIWLGICGFTFCGGLAKFLMASGYEVSDDD